MIRFDLYHHILKQEFALGQGHIEKYSQIKIIFYSLSKLGRILSNFPFRNLSKYDYLWVPHPRRKKVNNNYIDIYSNYYYPVLSGKTLFLERLHEHQHRTPIPEKNVLWFDIEEIIQIIAAFYRILVPLRKKEKRELRDQLKLLEDGLDIKINQKYFEKLLYKKISNYRFLKIVIRSLLLKVKPKAVYQIIHYSLVNLIINEQSKDIGIPTIELQHGILGDYNLAYHFNFNVNSPYFPDYVSVFGNYWKEITRLPIAEKRVWVTGFPFLSETKNELGQDKSTIKSGSNFLVLSQGTVGQTLSHFVEDLITSGRYPDINIFYKLHPSEYLIWKQLYPSLLNEQINVIDNDQISLYEYFSISDWVLGVYSTAIFEAIFYNLPVFILKTEGYQYMDDLIKKGVVELIEKAEDIRLNEAAVRENNFSEELCATNWKNNFKQLIDFVENASL